MNNQDTTADAWSVLITTDIGGLHRVEFKAETPVTIEPVQAFAARYLSTRKDLKSVYRISPIEKQPDTNKI